MHHSLGHSSAGERETIDLINLLVCQTVHDAMIGSGGGRAGERNMSGAGAVARTEVDMILAEVAWVPGPGCHGVSSQPPRYRAQVMGGNTQFTQHLSTSGFGQ